MKVNVSQVAVVRADASEGDEVVVVEEPLEIQLAFGPASRRQRKSLSVTMRTPGEDEELALGFLFGEDILASRSDVVEVKPVGRPVGPRKSRNVVRVELSEGTEVDLSRLERQFYTSSSCGVCGKASVDAVRTARGQRPPGEAIRIPATTILRMPAAIATRQTTFLQTGGLHAAALFDETGELTRIREDVGRHNAVDKIVGAAFHAGELPLSRSILLVSGRGGFELVQKASMASLPIMVAIGAPSSLAIDLAKESGMTLVAFLREDRFNVYSSPERIVFDAAGSSGRETDRPLGEVLQRVDD